MTQAPSDPGTAISRRHMLRAAGATSLGLAVTGSTAGEMPNGTAARCESAAFAAGPLADLLHGPGLDAREFGAKFDNSTDDAPALQRAIDAAHEQRRALRLPGGIAILGQPLSLLGRDVSIIGEGVTATVLRAGTALPALIDVQETTDRIVSPFALMRLTLDGARQTERNLALRFRHHTWLFEVNSIAADTGFWERDCWLARRYNCRTGDNRIGWHLVGSNHSSLFEACTMSACSEAHLVIGNEGSAPDGNASLVFRNCDVEFGPGHGVVVAFATNSLFEGCYIGENIGGDVLRNNGFVVMRGGALFFGGGTGVGIRPLGGVASLDGVSINGQAGGIANLVNLGAAEAVGEHGQVRIVNANANLPVGGEPVLQGDPLARIPMPTFAPHLGRDWRGWAEAVAISETRSPDGLPDGREVTCTGVRGASGRIGLRAPLTRARWRESAPVYLACVYRATAPFDLRLTAPETGSVQVMVTVPASPARATYVNVSIVLPADGFSVIEAVMPATPGARLGLQEVTLGDGTNIRSPSGNLKTLALAQ